MIVFDCNMIVTQLERRRAVETVVLCWAGVGLVAPLYPSPSHLLLLTCALENSRYPGAEHIGCGLQLVCEFCLP